MQNVTHMEMIQNYWNIIHYWLAKEQTHDRGIILLPSRSSRPQVQSTVICPYSKNVGNVLVFYNPPKTSIIYITINVFFCSFPNSPPLNWKCSCPPHHHTWYLLGHFCLVQSITPKSAHYNTYTCITTTLPPRQSLPLHFRTRFKKICLICK